MLVSVRRAAVCLVALLFVISFLGGALSAPSRETRKEKPSPDGLPQITPTAGGLVVWSYRWPKSAAGMNATVERAIAGFRLAHPDTKVQVTFMGATALQRSLEDAFARHEQPDVVVHAPGYTARYKSAPQVDFRTLLRKADLQAYHTAAIGGCSDGEGLWALPWWVEGRAWLANQPLIERSGYNLGATSGGWVWKDFEAVCRKLKSDGRLPVSSLPSAELLLDLGGPIGGDVTSLERSAPVELLRSLAGTGLARVQRDPASAIALFSEKNTGFIVGLSPLLGSDFLRLTREDPLRNPGAFDPHLVPIPSTGIRGTPLVRVGGIMVFRRPWDLTGSRVALASDLARRISTETWEKPYPALLMPAFLPNVGRWLEERRWDGVVVMRSIQTGQPLGLVDAAALQERLRWWQKARESLVPGSFFPKRP